MTDRAKAIMKWLGARRDTRVGRLSEQWFRAYFQASRNSGSAATLYAFLALVPAVLVLAAVVQGSTSNTNLFADHLISHMHLHDPTASLVRDTFGTVSSNLLAASISAAISCLIWGLGIGQIYQDLYARAWKVKAGSLAADQAMFAVWFVVAAGALVLALLAAEHFEGASVLIVLPVWLIGSMIFWLWTPYFLLHRKVSLRRLLPGATVGALVLGGTIATAPLWIAPSLYTYGKAFSSFGIVVTLLAYAFIWIVISMACAVFSPVWTEWRLSEKHRQEQCPTHPTKRPAGSRHRESESRGE